MTKAKKEPFFQVETFYETGVTDPYMTRISAGDFSIHIMWRGDRDEAPHDHARGFVTFPLTSYVESTLDHPLKDPEREFDLIRHVVPAFRFHRRAAEYRHRIDGRFNGYRTTTGEAGGEYIDYGYEPTTKSGPIITLVWWEKPYRRWGFWPMDPYEGRRWVWWRTHLYGEQDDERTRPITFPVRLKPNNRLLWRLWCVWIMQTRYGYQFTRRARESYGLNIAKWVRYLKKLLQSDWQYSQAMVELAEDACDFMPPRDYEPMTPQDAIDVDREYWDDDSGDE